MGTASASPTRAPNFRAIQFRLAEALSKTTCADGSPSPTLEIQRSGITEPARFARATIIEGRSLVRYAVSGAAEVGFDAFLDGIQASRVLLHDAGIPIVHGAVSAVVRVRHDRKLTTWRHLAESRVYAPRECLTPTANSQLEHLGVDVVDTTPRREDGGIDVDAQHPLMLADVAVHAVQGHREILEQTLAQAWVGQAIGILYVDGGISGVARIATAANVIGVVKSHRVLYGDASTVRTILSLVEGERSSVFTIGSLDGRRSPVASWYLRIRDAADRNPLWGLVRVEVAPSSVASDRRIGDRADEVSRWILAEAAPLSLPDSRWDTMIYGIRDCEQFLRSIS